MIEAIRTLRWADYLYCLLFDNERLAVLLEEGKPFLPATVVFPILHALFLILTVSTLKRENSSLFFVKLSYGFFSLALFLLLLEVIKASLASFALSLMKVTPDTLRIFSILNLASFPRLFVLPITVFLVSIHPVYTAPGLLAATSFSVLNIVSIMFAVRSVAFLHKISMMKSFASTIMPLFITGCLLFFIATGSFMIMFYAISQYL
ncbi:MAG: hypothetical protein PF637_08180 [Spirochaetes bacterium]|jgi:hypothetical protein|nr:hypothetical protein [Spirochaetota bacterium]